MELLIWAIEKGMVPVLADTEFFNEMKKEILCGKQFRKQEATEFIKENLQQRKELLEKGAKIQSMQSFDSLEQEVHEKLEEMGLSPQGKKLLRTNYGTFIVPDNYFEKSGEIFAVFASKNDINGVIGSAAMAKELVSPAIRTIGLVLFTRRKKCLTRLQNTLLKTYVDYFCTSTGDLKQINLGP